MHHIVVLLFVALALLSPKTRAECELAEQQCVTENQWQLGIAIGIGVRQNPLHDGDHIPLVILPDIAWYGESAYFDNGELGYQFIASDNMALETFVSVNDERANFSFWHPANILFSQAQISNGLSPDMGPEFVEGDRTSISINNIAKRDWAIDGGIRWHYWQGNNQWQGSIKHDVSSVHKGAQVSLSYHHHWQADSWSITLKPQLQWKSRQLLDYYYGLSPIDKVDKVNFYDVPAAWIPSLSVVAVRPFSEKWMWLIKSSVTHLPSALVNSPIVDKNNVASAFIGVAHRF